MGLGFEFEMKHATNESLKAIAPLLRSLSALEALRERSPGTYYLKSGAFLHFHEDPAGLFADVKIDGAWQRLPVNSKTEQDRLLRLVTAAIGKAPACTLASNQGRLRSMVANHPVWVSNLIRTN